MVGAFFVILYNFKLREGSFEALLWSHCVECIECVGCPVPPLHPAMFYSPRLGRYKTPMSLTFYHKLLFLPFILDPGTAQHSLIVTYQYVGPVQKE